MDFSALHPSHWFHTHKHNECLFPFDVFAVEPPQDKDLLELPNFLVTPHIGGSAQEAILAMGRAAINGLDDNKIP